MSRHRIRRPVIGASFALAAVVGAACGSSATAPSAATKSDAANASVTVAVPAADPKVLRVGLIPNVAPDTQKAKYRVLADHLEKALGAKVELFVATNYAGTVAALEAGQLDLAYLGGLSYAQARQRTAVVPLVTEVDRETHTPKYLSQIITRTDSGVNSLADLKGKAFAFGDPGSTSGSLFPRMMLRDAGYTCSTTTLTECAGLGTVTFTGGHDAAAAAVNAGQVAAAGIEARILHRLEKDGKVDASKIKVLDNREVQGYPWVAPTTLPEAFRDKIIAAFQGITDPALLDVLRAESYVKVVASDYDEVETAAKALGLLRPAK